MITYPEMNEKIKDLLRAAGLNYTAYAAQRIEELEAENRKLREVAKAAILLDPQPRAGRGCLQFAKYILYILRWMVLAVPGAWFLMQAENIIPNVYLAMVISQGMLGAAVYFVDRWILTNRNGR